MSAPPKRALALLCAPLLALALSACAKTVSTSGLSGESKEVAETIKNLEADVTAGEQKKVCQNDLASTLVTRLSSAKGGCQQAITVDSVALGGTPAARTAIARVKSVYSGNKRPSTLSLVKESGKWKISALG
jgi:hypothetical protein